MARPIKAVKAKELINEKGSVDLEDDLAKTVEYLMDSESREGQ